MRTVATSTVALTAYNLLAVGSGARTPGELEGRVLSWARECGLEVPREQMAAAIAELARRGYVRSIRGMLDVADPLRRAVVARDRSDEGGPNPGWCGWRVQVKPNAAPHLVSLEDVIR